MGKKINLFNIKICIPNLNVVTIPFTVPSLCSCPLFPALLVFSACPLRVIEAVTHQLKCQFWKMSQSFLLDFSGSYNRVKTMLHTSMKVTLPHLMLSPQA